MIYLQKSIIGEYQTIITKTKEIDIESNTFKEITYNTIRIGEDIISLLLSRAGKEVDYRYNKMNKIQLILKINENIN